MSKFGHFKPGDAPTFKADSVNAWQDVAQWYSESGFGGKGSQSLGGPEIRPSIVSVEADSFTTFGAVLTPTGPSANDPATNPVESSRKPCITAGVPTSEDDGIVIVFDPAIHGGTGDPGFAKAVASGVATVMVLVTDSAHRYARPEPGNSEYLVSDDYGPAWLMLPTDATAVGTEPVSTLVLLGPPQPVAVATAPRRKYLLDLPCLTRDGYGAVNGLAGVIVNEDWSADCEVKGFCESGCTPDPSDTPTPPTPGECVTVSGTVKLQPEDSGVYTGLDLVSVGPFFSDVGTGAYSVNVSFHSGAVGFGCYVPESEAPRDVYYSLDGGASWSYTSTGSFMLTLPTSCVPKEVLWELWQPGEEPEVVVPGDGPPDPPPETFDVFVQVFESDPDPETGICGAGTEPGTYSVTVAGSTQGTQTVPSGGIWFTGCPWGVDTTCVLSYGGSEMVMWGAASVGCGGAGSFGFGTSAPVSGALCDEFSYSFTVGDCGAFPPITEIETAKPIEE